MTETVNEHTHVRAHARDFSSLVSVSKRHQTFERRYNFSVLGLLQQHFTRLALQVTHLSVECGQEPGTAPFLTHFWPQTRFQSLKNGNSVWER